ncbi:hypothetical protein [Chroococcidiopsis sp.]|uniref:hypothetical protein n=1 Tax=Chroococcidiopsis sp. TaxID=3088168 RepID=UPI003F2DB7D5
MSVVVGAGLASRFTGSSHYLRSKPARTVVSYQLSVISYQGAGSSQPSTVNQFPTPYTLHPSFFNHNKITNDE